MTEEPTKESVKVLLDYLGNRLFQIQNYYQIYSELGLHYNKAVNEESAKAYLDVINKHKAFFLPVQDCLRATLTVELCSFVVKKEQKYKSIGRAIKDLAKLTDAPDLSSDYNRLLRKNSNIIKHIDEFRNQYYAHKSFSDLAKLTPSSDKEYRELFDDLKDLLNEANSYFGNSVVFINESTDETHDLMNNLLRGEAQRLSEINVDYIANIYQSGRHRWHKED